MKSLATAFTSSLCPSGQWVAARPPRALAPQRRCRLEQHPAQQPLPPLPAHRGARVRQLQRKGAQGAQLRAPRPGPRAPPGLPASTSDYSGLGGDGRGVRGDLGPHSCVLNYFSCPASLQCTHLDPALNMQSLTGTLSSFPLPPNVTTEECRVTSSLVYFYPLPQFSLCSKETQRSSVPQVLGSKACNHTPPCLFLPTSVWLRGQDDTIFPWPSWAVSGGSIY